jgi:glycosyltransferase involved in cell wall biosynthesis
VLWVGTREPRKNLRRLIEAFGRLDSVDADLVLVGPEGWHGDVEAPAEVADRIRTLGFVPGDDLSGLYRAARVFCYPSLREGFGMPVLEAMAHGAPTITSSTTATAEVAGDAAVLIDPTDVSALRDALAEMLDDDAAAADLSRAGVARARAFPWSRTAELTVSAYEEVVR